MAEEHCSSSTHLPSVVPADPHDTPESHAALLPTPQLDIGSRWAVASEGHAGAGQKRVQVSSLLSHSQGHRVLLAASYPALHAQPWPWRHPHGGNLQELEMLRPRRLQNQALGSQAQV